VYWLKVHQIPTASRTSAGRAIANVLSLRAEEKITSVIPVRQFDSERYLLMATRRGLIKKTKLEEYSRPRNGGIIGINLDDGDTLIDVVLTQPGEEVVLSTRGGMAIRFSEADARPMGRATRGVKGINLSEGDELVGMVVADPEGYLLTVCENGYGKRTPFGPNTVRDAAEGEGESESESDETGEPEPPEQPESESEEGPKDRSSMRYRRQRRGGKGVRDIRTSDRNGPVVGAVAVRPGDDIMLITAQGMVNRTHVDEIREVGRNTQGVRVMNLNEGDKIASLANVIPEEGETRTAEPDAPAPETTS
jgi:DNA gyrase subunit A